MAARPPQSPDASRRQTRAPCDVSLDVRIVPQLAMMIHELGTNSSKYGALSTPAGTIDLTWSLGDDMLKMIWREIGGPALKGPVKRGLGTTLIERSAQGAGGGARMTLDASGVIWDIELQLPHAAPQKSGAHHPQARKLSATKLREAKELAGKHFLVVEDEALVAMEIVDLLEDAGAHVVAWTGSASEALRHIDSTLVHAALLDANLFGQPVDESQRP